MKLLRQFSFITALTVCLSIVLFLAYPLLWLIIFADAIRRVGPAAHRERVSRWAMRWASRAVSAFGWLMRCRISFRLPRQLDRKSPAVVIVNHRSTLDILIMLAALGRMGYSKARFVAKREASSIPVIGRAALEMGCAFIGRRGEADDLGRIGLCAAGALEDGSCLVIFPEGTTFHNPAFVSSRAGKYRHVLPPRAGGLKAALAFLAVWPVLSVTQDWGNVEGADTIPGLFPLYGRAITVEGEFISGPGEEPVERWLNREWERKDERIEAMHAGA